ncbi:MAG TPA: TonB family protein [Longimicrobium sp.]|nr:TonB family protein [Longimicrobium sp.]
MPDTALAPRLIPLRCRSNGMEMALDSALEIGVGGEARVLGLRWDPTLVAKLYHRPTLEHARKLVLMIETPPTLPEGVSIAWPVELLTDPRGARCAGFLMRRAEGPRVFEFYNPVSRRKTAPLFDWARLHRAGANLAAAFDALHAAGYVIGDVNESNILVSPEDASIVLVDADSMQVRGPRPGELYRSKVGKAEFTPPELQGTHFAEVDRAPEHDRFGLATLLFLLLMEGTHPFACRLADGGEVPQVEERISRGMFPYAPDADGCRPPRMAPPFYTLHPQVQALFLRAFVQGQTDPSARPTAGEWAEALRTAEAALATCAENPRHRHAAHVDFCPWCHRSKVLQGRDPFPATVDQARVHDAPALRRPMPAPPRPGSYPAPAHAGPQHRPPPPWAQPAAAAVMQPPPPSRMSVWASSTLNRTQSALPAWAQPALGPDALANPLVWMPPAALTCLFGATGGMRVVGMLVFFLALRRMFRLNTIRLRAVTAVWIMVMLVGWAVLAGATGGMGADDDDYEYSDYDQVAPPPPVVDLDAQPPVAPNPPGSAWVEPRALAGDGVATVALRNKAEVDEALVAAYPAELREQGVGGTVRLRVPLDDAGNVVGAGVEVIDASTTELGFAAASVAQQMNFNFVDIDDDVDGTTVEVTVHFTP